MVKQSLASDDEMRQLDEQLPFGWVVYEVHDECHVIPVKDTKLHEPSASCWCGPIEVDVGYYEHEAKDGRSDYESGERKHH